VADAGVKISVPSPIQTFTSMLQVDMRFGVITLWKLSVRQPNQREQTMIVKAEKNENGELFVIFPQEFVERLKWDEETEVNMDIGVALFDKTPTTVVITKKE
jgi:hypothetical protein